MDVTSGTLLAFVGMSSPGFSSMLPTSNDEASRREDTA